MLTILDQPDETTPTEGRAAPYEPWSGVPAGFVDFLHANGLVVSVTFGRGGPQDVVWMWPVEPDAQFVADYERLLAPYGRRYERPRPPDMTRPIDAVRKRPDGTWEGQVLGMLPDDEDGWWA